MLNITISADLKEKATKLQLFCIEAEVVVRPSDQELWYLVENRCRYLSENLQVEAISSLSPLQASRKAYKASGKDPARYRLSAEALLRRAVREKGIYRINNLVDLLNLVSIETGFSIGGYDAGQINGDIEFGIGVPGESYAGIGRGELNIAGLPVFRDASGAFGSPTSDSERTRVGPETTRFLMIIIDFGAGHLLHPAGDRAVNLLRQFAEAENIETYLIG